MAKYDCIWELFDKYNFEIDYKTYKDLTCVICNKILINATQSSCGCRYCYSCITEYLNGKPKFCPKDSEECKNHLINLENNDLQIDHAVNRIISKIEVKCPIEVHCEVRTELQHMKDHIQWHKYQCPFQNIGCQTNCNNSEALHQHLIENSHATLLAGVIDNMKLDNNRLNEKVSLAEAKIEQLTELNSELTQQMADVKNGEKEINNKIKILEDDGHFKQNLINEMVEEIVKIRSCVKNFENFPSESHQVDSNTIPRRNSKFSVTSSTLPGQLYSPFSWIIEDFLTKWDSAKNGIVKSITSDFFLSHKMGYRIRLSLYPNGYGPAENTYVSVLFGLVEGEFDHKLPWPMKREIKIALIDQQSGSIHVSEKFNYDSTEKQSKYIFHKPSTSFTSNNVLYGASKFIKINSLIVDNRLFKNGSILLKCFVH